MQKLEIVKKEKEIYKFWNEKKFFESSVDSRRTPYTIVIPPPNVTGALHLGHALNNTIQDTLVRFHRMKGYNTCWLPGTDHAGIATQSVVEKILMDEEGKTRHDIGRKAMIDRIWKWVDLYGNRIIDQLKSMGCSCDWSKLSFTIDDNLSYAVKYVFHSLYEEGLVYRGKRLINWCPGCQTALSNDELVFEEHDSKLWDIRYPVKGLKDTYLVVATTRPETMLGDTAVAVHPNDERYKKMIGKSCIIPIINREIPIIGDGELVDMEFGTGVVKVTPGHDPNDYACGKRNGLPIVNIMNIDGTLNENAGAAYNGKKVGDGRRELLKDLKEQGYYVGEKDIKNDIAHCYRSHDVVEPIVSGQWFVKMEPMVELARQAVLNDEIKFTPKGKKNDLLRWLDSTPDWCISRQIWWGHRINVWYCIDCNEIELLKNGEPVSIPDDAPPILPDKNDLDSSPQRCPECGKENLIQDPDLLDTWFSSQLWPISTFGWPNESKNLDYYYPTSVLSTARDILALWVARMIMMGKKFMGKVPFTHVNIHGTILDDNGDIMSKSRGNGVDPMVLITGGEVKIKGKAPLKDKDIPAERTEVYPAYGADSLRFALMYLTLGQGQNIKVLIEREKRSDGKYEVRVPKIEEAVRLCHKIWQASHGVIFSNVKDSFEYIENLHDTVMTSNGHYEDKWMYSRLVQISKQISDSYTNFNMGDACDNIYHFFWDEFCSYYLELLKPRLWGRQGKKSEMQAKNMLLFTFETIIKLIHPVMPFISEHLWQEIKGIKESLGITVEAEACIVDRFPDFEGFNVDEASISLNVDLQKVIYSLNNIKSENNITKKIPLMIFVCRNTERVGKFEYFNEALKKLLKVEEIKFRSKHDEKAGFKTASRIVSPEIEIVIPLESFIDFDQEKKKLQANLEKSRTRESALLKKMSNEKFVNKAPAQVVETERKKLENLQSNIAQLEKKLTTD